MAIASKTSTKVVAPNPSSKKAMNVAETQEYLNVAKRGQSTGKKVATVKAPKKVASLTPKLDALQSQGNVRREWDAELAEVLAQEFAEVYGPKIATLTGAEIIGAIRSYVRYTGYKHLFRALKDAGY